MRKHKHEHARPKIAQSQSQPPPPTSATIQSNGASSTSTTTTITNNAGYVCEYCGKMFATNESKLQHMEIHNVGSSGSGGGGGGSSSVNSGEKYYCNVCGIYLSSVQNYNEHNRVVHQQRNDDKQYKYQHQMKPHMNRPDNGRPYAYPNNGPKAFYDRSSNGRDHMKPMHINEQ